jgi:hypothetical protein
MRQLARFAAASAALVTAYRGRAGSTELPDPPDGIRLYLLAPPDLDRHLAALADLARASYVPHPGARRRPRSRT